MFTHSSFANYLTDIYVGSYQLPVVDFLDPETFKHFQPKLAIAGFHLPPNRLRNQRKRAAQEMALSDSQEKRVLEYFSQLSKQISSLRFCHISFSETYQDLWQMICRQNPKLFQNTWCTFRGYFSVSNLLHF